jgi:hypothetical protein
MARQIAAAALAALVLAGCGGVARGQLTEKTIELEDGRTITCVTYRPPAGGGLSCDWNTPN